MGSNNSHLQRNCLIGNYRQTYLVDHLNAYPNSEYCNYHYSISCIIYFFWQRSRVYIWLNSIGIHFYPNTWIWRCNLHSSFSRIRKLKNQKPACPAFFIPPSMADFSCSLLHKIVLIYSHPDLADGLPSITRSDL